MEKMMIGREKNRRRKKQTYRLLSPGLDRPGVCSHSSIFPALVVGRVAFPERTVKKTEIEMVEWQNKSERIM